MNILFIGPYRQNDEWGRKSLAVLKGIQNTDHTVTSRPIYLSTSANYNNYMERSETIIADHYDILIQFVLQPFAVYSGNFNKRIGIFNTETIPNNIPLGQLTSELLMDEIWTDSHIVAKNLQAILQKHTANPKVVAIPPSLNLNDLPPKPNPPSSLRASAPHLQNKFLFYYIGNVLEDTTGFKEIYTAYLNTFTFNDAVALIVGLEIPIPPDELNKCFTQYRESISHLAPVSHVPTVHVVYPTNNVYLNTAERVSMHTDCDCMVSPSYTMTNHSTVLEGALYHSTPIVNKGSTIAEWLKEENLWYVESYEEVCTKPPSNNIYRFTYGESWHRPIIKSLGETMKRAYVDKFQRDKKIKTNTQLRQHFQELSYSNILDI